MQNMLADKIEKQKVDNQAEAVEREELKDLESQDLVNEQSKQYEDNLLFKNYAISQRFSI